MGKCVVARSRVESVIITTSIVLKRGISCTNTLVFARTLYILSQHVRNDSSIVSNL
jgi:hypothetical protein